MSYNPQGRGQVERLNSIIRKTASLCLRSKVLNFGLWEYVLPDALHAIRSFLCTAINATPHERMFSHNQKSSTGSSLSQWLVMPGPVLCRKNVRTSKYGPLVEVKLLDSNPEYAQIRLRDNHEKTVSFRQLDSIRNTS
ncbi:Gag-Pro-Pol polyprotein [Paragonimus skrjabini miyazakii]|uniref:Gag-Pro-Pol polyprotein n=1 Tax=Paragonimus skrjabini miyazakii TaxID=59628 RepID=A0A8S9YRS5_9TREM|nr:Gag-Pro-Pol polyprotein [Paragonimus skrjabini miyazakii]